jgi:MraZ protein
MSNEVINNASAGEASMDGALMGTFEHALDPKRRITIPSVWREVMGSPAYLCVMADPHDACLTIIPPNVLRQRLQKLREQPVFDEGLTEALRDLFSDAEYLAVDVQGRIRISDGLLAFAQLEDMVHLVGVGTRIQIWAPAKKKLRGAKGTSGPDQAALAQAAKTLKF